MRYFLICITTGSLWLRFSISLAESSGTTCRFIVYSSTSNAFRVIATLNFGARDCSWIVAWRTGISCIPKRMGS